MIKKGTKRAKIVIYILIIISALMIIFMFTCGGKSTNPYKKNIDYILHSDFEKHMLANNIVTVYYGSNADYLYAKLKTGEWIETLNINPSNFKEELVEHGVIVKDIADLKFGEDDDESLINNCAFILLIIWGIVILIILIFAIKLDTTSDNNTDTLPNLPETLFNDTNKENKTKRIQDETRVKTFADVAGLKEVKEDIKSIVDFITNKEKYIEAGAKLPKGIILYGPPGTGKTLLAKAIAGEAEVEFLYMSGSDFVEMYVGVGAKRVRELFSKARASSPCIVFIDEIDSIGNVRSNKNETTEDRKTLNALLTEMDGFNETENIIVIGATNRIEDLDPALMRPGRFTDKFCVPIPQTSSEREEIIRLYMKGKRFGDDVVLNDMAKETSGFSPAQIESWINEAAIMQVQKGKRYITKNILDEAMSKMLMHGHIRKDQSERSELELNTVAWHEAGHAILGRLFGNTISKVTILRSTSGAGGITFSIPKNINLLSIQDMEMKVMELYGGRLAELIFNNGNEQLVTTGASNDIEKATNIIHSMVVSYGMTKEFGLLNLEYAGTDKEYIINKEVEISKRLQEQALELLMKNYSSLEKLANQLLEQDTVYAKDIEQLELKV